MLLKKLTITILLVLVILYMLACATLRNTYNPPSAHPKELDVGRPLCTVCHESRDEHTAYEQFNHSVYFTENHRFQAYQNKKTCQMCHMDSFCNTCHANRIELNPSIKNQAETYKKTPHRGDYLSRHAIEGRIDPISCYRCHGNPKTSKTCISCHG